MSAPTLAARWSNWGPQLRSVLRIVAALIFVQAGTMKLFGFPVGMPAGATAPFLSQTWIGGFLEAVGGGLLVLGLFTRPVARLDPYTPPDPRRFLCAAPTPPGGGVHGSGGYWAARAAPRRRGSRPAPAAG